MAKKKEAAPRRELTRRQLARWQQQQRRQRLIMSLGILVIVAVLAVVGAGWYLNQYQPRHETVIRVNDTRFDMNYYVEALTLYAGGQPTQFIQFLADLAVRDIQQNELVRQEAVKLSIAVSRDAIDQELKRRQLPVNRASRDIVRAELLRTKLLDEYFDPQLPLSAEQRHVLAMFLESRSQANEAKTRLDSGEDFARLATQLSMDAFSKEKQGDLGWRPRGVLTELVDSSIPEDYVFTAQVGALSQPLYDEAKTKPVGYWLVKLLTREADLKKAHIQVMLLSSEEEAKGVRGRLESGEDFGQLAKERSQHGASKEGGGDLSDLAPGTMAKVIDDFVFSPSVEPGTLSQPIRDDKATTKGGYWLVKVVEVDNNKKIADEDRDTLKRKALNEWFISILSDPNNKVESYLDTAKKQYAISQVLGG